MLSGLFASSGNRRSAKSLSTTPVISPQKTDRLNTHKKEEQDASDSGTTSAPSFSQKFSTRNAPFACFQGTCNRGSDCTFAHGSEDMQVDGWKPTERLVDFVNH